MQAIEEFSTTLTLCFTPEHLGVVPHYTSPPKNYEDFAEFTRRMVSRYAPRQSQRPAATIPSENNETYAQLR
jgi:beta-xylosidase